MTAFNVVLVLQLCTFKSTASALCLRTGNLGGSQLRTAFSVCYKSIESAQLRRPGQEGRQSGGISKWYPQILALDMCAVFFPGDVGNLEQNRQRLKAAPAGARSLDSISVGPCVLIRHLS